MPKKANRESRTIIEADIIRADVVQARCFTLVDEAKKCRAFLQATSDSSGTVVTQLQMLDDKSWPRFDLMVLKDQAVIGVLNDACQDRISLVDNKLGSAFSVRGEFGESWICCGAADEEQRREGHPSTDIMVDDARTGRKWRLDARN